MAPYGEAAVDRERSRRDRHRAKLALPETSGGEGVNVKRILIVLIVQAEQR